MRRDGRSQGTEGRRQEARIGDPILASGFLASGFWLLASGFLASWHLASGFLASWHLASGSVRAHGLLEELADFRGLAGLERITIDEFPPQERGLAKLRKW